MNCAVCGTVVPLQMQGNGVVIPASKYWLRDAKPGAMIKAVFCGFEHCHQYLEEHKDAT